jgi:hypothetical protein
VDREIRRQVDERLEEVYGRHLRLSEGDVARYYRSGDGYYRPERAVG